MDWGGPPFYFDPPRQPQPVDRLPPASRSVVCQLTANK